MDGWGSKGHSGTGRDRGREEGETNRGSVPGAGEGEGEREGEKEGGVKQTSLSSSSEHVRQMGSGVAESLQTEVGLKDDRDAGRVCQPLSSPRTTHVTPSDHALFK